ncbi:MAG: hypothetical protein JSR25_02315, partial [Proteobacteria bacterium]|nr:hypothetical protein [Pseudomonadota bacterium]
MSGRKIIFVGLALLLASPAAIAQPKPSAMDRDLIEVTVPQLQQFYASRKY